MPEETVNTEVPFQPIAANYKINLNDYIYEFDGTVSKIADKTKEIKSPFPEQDKKLFAEYFNASPINDSTKANIIKFIQEFELTGFNLKNATIRDVLQEAFKTYQQTKDLNEMSLAMGILPSLRKTKVEILELDTDEKNFLVKVLATSALQWVYIEQVLSDQLQLSRNEIKEILNVKQNNQLVDASQNNIPMPTGIH